MHDVEILANGRYISPTLPARMVIGRPHWWQWPNILSLDAPAVAVLWQGLLARVAGVTLAWPHVIVLGASVWLAYAADRWIEGWRLTPTDVRTQRHHFSQRWRWPLTVLWAVVFIVDVCVAVVWLTPGDIHGGAVLLLMVLAYLLSHQLIHRDCRWRVPKELCVAMLLASGVALFAFAPQHPETIALPLGIFGLLCFGNCALISVWERDVDRIHRQTSLALQFRLGAPLSRCLPWGAALAAAVACGVAQGWTREAMACALASSVLLGGVDIIERRIGPQLARVLADLALMTPLVPLLHRA